MGFARYLFFAVIGGAAAASAGAPQVKSASPAPKAIQSCDAHKFETVVEAIGADGQPHQSKVKLCGNEGQTDAEWIHTLEDAVSKLDGNKEMAAAMRDQIVTAIKAEIARLSSSSGQTLSGQTIDLRKRDVVAGSAQPLSRDYAALPPLPTTPPPPPRVLGTRVASATGGMTTVALLPSIPAPKLSFDCYAPGDIGGDAPCTDFVRETMLTIKAEQDVPAGVALKFVRNGTERGEIQLAQLKRGKSIRIPLPESVCSGFTNGRLDLRIVHEVGLESEELSSDGPYVLRC